ncbi:response regulator [Streptacidiphilus rugosus]|uniref:response regulator n=1 Tax=Streptacidiphilus rugosus TaxID=405783 RepID=UPI000AF3106C|nr:response regulator transcription factor [Streptacidiphilus rugosus]
MAAHGPEADARVRVLVVDDHPAIRLGLRVLIEDQQDLRLVAETGAVGEALRLVLRAEPQERPDVVLLDLDLGQGTAGGLDLVRRFDAMDEPPAVLVFSGHNSDADIFAAIDAGAVGFLGKETDPDALLSGIRAAARGETVLGASAVRRVLRRVRGSAPVLSSREVEVLQLLGEGLPNRKIAARLYISEATAKGHLASIYAKLGVDTRGAAVATAVREGLLRLG